MMISEEVPNHVDMIQDGDGYGSSSCVITRCANDVIGQHTWSIISTGIVVITTMSTLRACVRHATTGNTERTNGNNMETEVIFLIPWTVIGRPI